MTHDLDSQIYRKECEIRVLQRERNDLLRQQLRVGSVVRPKSAEKNWHVIEIMARVLGAFEDAGGGFQKLGTGAPTTSLTVGRRHFYIEFAPTERERHHVLFFDVHHLNRSVWKGRFGVDVGNLLGARLHLEYWRRPRHEDWERAFLASFTTRADRWLVGTLQRAFLQP